MCFDSSMSSQYMCVLVLFSQSQRHGAIKRPRSVRVPEYTYNATAMSLDSSMSLNIPFICIHNIHQYIYVYSTLTHAHVTKASALPNDSSMSLNIPFICIHKVHQYIYVYIIYINTYMCTLVLSRTHM